MQNLSYEFSLFFSVTPQEITWETWNSEYTDSIVHLMYDERILTLKWTECIKYGIKQMRLNESVKLV